MCRTFQSKSYIYAAGSQLPVERVLQGNSFQCIGIDCAGPQYVKNMLVNDNKMYEVWVVEQYI